MSERKMGIIKSKHPEVVATVVMIVITVLLAMALWWLLVAM